MNPSMNFNGNLTINYERNVKMKVNGQMTLTGNENAKISKIKNSQNLQTMQKSARAGYDKIRRRNKIEEITKS